ncbi:MAG: SH3 domain-containing protein [Victivallaceae bacterium]|nr:SH3 domain-containing protein [Victivallaceae bacterium]
MDRFLIIILMVIAAAGAADSGKSITGTVKVDDKLNVRVKPGREYFVVATLRRGDKVEIFRQVDDWYEIAAPSASSVWVAGHFMTDSRTRRAVNLRAGPSSDYQAYRTEPAGVTLEVIDRTGDKGWFKVKPPVGLKAWVNSRFVEVDAAELKALQSAQNPRKLILIDSETGDFAGFLKKADDAKPPFILPFVKGTAAKVTLSGRIVPLRPGAVYVTHALLLEDKPGNLMPAAYLHCQKASLNVWLHKIVTVSGSRQLVSGWKLPVIEVDAVIPEPEKPRKPQK